LVGGNSVIDLQRALPDKAWTVSTLSILGAWDAAGRHCMRGGCAAISNTPACQRALARSAALSACDLLHGANYMDHAEEMSAEKKGVDKATTQPYLFLKSGPHCVIGPGDAIRLPNVSDKVDWEGEFAVVIGKRARNVSVDNAMQYVAGYTIMNESLRAI
jgi:2-keto-4-pentenoate hydratase/2-oxohepta-3-ene-1,7-dioic acid hydratase in catechol pathway